MTASTELMWSELSRANSLNPAQRHRWRLVAREVFRTPLESGAVIADLGCGSGSLLRQLSQRSSGARCVGIDIEPLALDLARKALPEGEFHRVDLSDAGLTVPPELKNIADVVVCSEVLEHLENPHVAVDFARGMLRPGGRVVMTVPSGPMTPLDRAIGHVRHYDLEAFGRLVERGDLRLESLYRWGFPFHSMFRAVVGMFRGVPSQCTDANFGVLASAAFRVLDGLFFFNVKSRHWGRQLVAVAARSSNA